MSDQDFYLQVENEIASGIQDKAMLAKAKIISEQNSFSTNVNYTKLRVSELKINATKEQSLAAAAKIGSILLKVGVAVLIMIVFLGYFF